MDFISPFLLPASTAALPIWLAILESTSTTTVLYLSVVLSALSSTSTDSFTLSLPPLPVLLTPSTSNLPESIIFLISSWSSESILVRSSSFTSSPPEPALNIPLTLVENNPGLPSTCDLSLTGIHAELVRMFLAPCSHSDFQSRLSNLPPMSCMLEGTMYPFALEPIALFGSPTPPPAVLSL